MPLFQRLSEWYRVTRFPAQAEDVQAQAGREAEYFLKRFFESHYNFKNAFLFPNRRVPAGRRRREIDLLVLTKKRLHVIEIKNWSGTLRCSQNQWIQVRRNGEVVSHPNLLADSKEKGSTILSHLRSQNIHLTDKFLANKIMFMNHNLLIEDRNLLKHPDILTRDKLDAYLSMQGRAGMLEQIFSSVIEWCVESDAASAMVDWLFGNLTATQFEELRTVLENLATWDSIHYFGSKVENGDLISITIGQERFLRDELKAIRRRYDLRWNRGKLWSLLKTILNLGPLGAIALPSGVRPLSTADFLYFHRAGKPQPEEIPLISLNHIILG